MLYILYVIYYIERKRDLEKMLQKLKIESEKAGMRLNLKKTI